MGEWSQLRARDREVRIGLIGYGYIAEHIHLPVLKGVAEAKIGCCVDEVEGWVNLLGN
jgi:predicted dehydrogenase